MSSSIAAKKMNTNLKNIHRLCIWLIAASLLLAAGPLPATAYDADSDFIYATGLFRKQRWQYATEAFEQFLKDHPKHPRAGLARLYLGLSLNSLDKYGPARNQFETFISENPNSRNLADAKYRIGECSYYLKEYPTAIAQLSDYLQNHKGHNLNQWASLMLGESYNATDEFGTAESVLRPLLESGPNARILPDTMFALAASMQGQKQWEKAIAEFRAVADQKSDSLSPRALARIGTIHFGNQMFAESSAAYDELVRDYGDKPIAVSAAMQSGIAQFQLGQFEQSLLRLERVPAASEMSAPALLWKGLCQRQLGRLDDARRELVQAYTAAGNTPLAAEILFNRAQIEVLDGKKDVASQMFLDLADRWPDDRHVADSLFNGTELKMETGDLAAARRLLNRLRNEYPEQARQPRTDVLEGRLLLSENKVPEAIAMLQAAAKADAPGEREKLLRNYHLVRALHRGGKFQEALDTFEPFHQRFADPESAEFCGAIALAAMSSLELKQYANAQQLAEEFLTRESDSDSAQAADALAARAVAACHLQQFDVTKSDLARLVQDFSDNSQTWTAILQSAEIAWQQEEFAMSAELFGMATRRESDPKLHLTALSGAAWSHYQLGQFEQAAGLFHAAHTQYATSATAAEAAYMEATSTFQTGMVNEAATQFLTLYDLLEKQIVDSAEHPGKKYFLDAGRMYARILGESDQTEAADGMWERLSQRFEKSPLLPEILDEWAHLNLQHENFKRSDEIFSRLLESFPDSKFAGQARLSLAESEMQANRLETALREFTAIALDQRYAAAEKEAALYHAIDIHAAQRDWPEVIRYAEIFADSYSRSNLAPNVQLLYAEALLDQKKPEEAESRLQLLRQSILDENLAPEPWTERIWVALAEVALARKKYTDIDDFAKELEQRNPNSGFLYQMRDVLGRRWKAQADFPRAREFFGRVVTDKTARGTETAARCQFLIAETFLLEEDYEAAVREYHRLDVNYAFDEWSARGLFQAAACETKLERFDEATRSYQDLLKDYPDSRLAEMAKDKLKALASIRK